MSKPTPSPPSAPVYRRRKPETTVLYQVLQEHLETFMAQLQGGEGGTNWPGFVERELQAFLDCGILARGFCRLHCEQCGKDELVAFSCKGRGFCNSCGGRRMADTAAHLVDCVLPEVPIRQWVLTVPHRVRYLIAFNRMLCGQVKRIFIRTVMSWLKGQARRSGLRGGQSGAVVFLQRFGGSINLNPHFHALVLDGVYTLSSSEEPVFHPTPDLEDHEVHALTWKIREKILRLLSKKGFIADESIPEEDTLPFGSSTLGECYSASVTGRIGLGTKKGAYVPREGRIGATRFFEFAGEGLAEVDGFTLHANVGIHGRKKKQLERLCRYMARPAIASKRLELLKDGRVRYRLRHPYHDGTRAIILEPMTLIEKLCALIPPPRANLVSYHGILAPNAALRPQVVPQPSSEDRRTLRNRRRKVCLDEISDPERQRRYTFAQLLKRVFKIEILVCPFCQGQRKLIAMITDPPVIRAILKCLKLPADPPALAPARWPP